LLTKLPRWVEYGAFALAWLAGTVIAVGLLGFQHQSVSHLSGTATLLGTQLPAAGGDILHLLAVLLSFLLGSALSGFLLAGGASLRLGRHYDSLLAIEGALLLAAIYFLSGEVSIGHYLASAACGVQNALATTYSGAIIRTTHVTGVFTDLGLMLGAALRGQPLDRRKGILLLLIISGFVLGGAAGALLYGALAFQALAVPAGLCLLLAAVYRVYAHRQAQPVH
jgi:uncharacterized membrane protein YoaK (UPF0700 family)